MIYYLPRGDQLYVSVKDYYIVLYITTTCLNLPLEYKLIAIANHQL